MKKRKKKILTKQQKFEATPLRIVQYLLATKAMLDTIDMN